MSAGTGRSEEVGGRIELLPTVRTNQLSARGTVIEVLKQGAYRVELANGHRCIAKASGKQRPNFFPLSPGNPVELEFHPYDLSRARIIPPESGSA